MNSKEQLYLENCYLPKSNRFVLLKSTIVEQLAKFWDITMTKRPELVFTNKAGSSDLDHPRAVNSIGKVNLTVCLSVWMHVRQEVIWIAWLPVCLSVTWGGISLGFFINLSEYPHPLVSVSVSVCISVCQTWHPMSRSATYLLSSFLKYDLFRKTILIILSMPMLFVKNYTCVILTGIYAVKGGCPNI